jgi:hypothetical protein
MMDPLITNGIDAALLRVLDKRGHDRDPANRRKPAAVPGKRAGDRRDEEKTDQETLDRETLNDEPADTELEADPDMPRHKLDDMA